MNPYYNCTTRFEIYCVVQLFISSSVILSTGLVTNPVKYVDLVDDYETIDFDYLGEITVKAAADSRFDLK